MASALVAPRRYGALAAILLLAVLAPAGAAAGGTLEQAPGPSFVPCPLERIDTQLVRCDNLTGAGAEAPFWIPEQQ